jgi:hypothetical protein
MEGGVGMASSNSLGGTNTLKSLSKFGAAGVLMHKTPAAIA